jgi:hypothetical protein
MLVKMWGKGNPHTWLVGMKISITTMEYNMENLQKPKTESALYISNSTPEEIQFRIQ